MAPLFHYSERPPASALRPWLWNYWEFRVESDEPGPVPHHVPPDGCTSIAIVGSSGKPRHLAASGPWLNPLVVPVAPGAIYWGVRCRPESGGLVLGVNPEQLRNRTQPLTPLAPDLARQLEREISRASAFDGAVAVIDRVFSAHLEQTPAPDPIAHAAVDQLVRTRGEQPITELARELDIAPRTLLRRFRGATGLTPKQFARICRFRYAALTVLEPGQGSWARVASGSGFADQAHLIHEFRLLTGLTPEELSDRIRQTRHGDFVV